MGYTKNTWNTDDIITADKLNAMETGIDGRYNPINLDAGYDFDNLKTAGYYMGSGIFPNSPVPTVAYVYHIEVYTSRQGFVTQKVTHYTGAVTNVYVRSFLSSWQTWQQLATGSSFVSLTGDQTVSGNKTFSGTTNTTGYLKQKRWSTTASIGGNTFVLNRIGDVVFASGQVTTTLTGETTASGTLPTGFRPYANFVISTNRGVGNGTLLFQQNGSVWVPATVNVDSYISGTYLAEDTLPTI